MFKSITSKIYHLNNDPGGVGTSCRSIDESIRDLRNAVAEKTDKIRLRAIYLTKAPDSPFFGMDPDELTACIVAGAVDLGHAQAARVAGNNPLANAAVPANGKK